MTLQGLTLHFVVLSFDRYSRDDVIGEVMLELESIDLSGSDTCPVPIAREITPRSFKVIGSKPEESFEEEEANDNLSNTKNSLIISHL